MQLVYTDSLLSCDSIANLTVANTVDHKNTQLNLYLDLIQFNTHEKNEILSYILKNKEGLYLEIGTGGDPIAELLSNIPENNLATIIACDVDATVLQALLERHKNLLKYINPIQGPRLILQQLDATKMDYFQDNSLSGINASAVVHEIISYAGGLEGFNKFFSESFRVLKEGGVLVYRDPEGVVDKNKIVNLALINKSIKLFTHIFIPKFLDQDCSNLVKLGNKYCIYSKKDIVVHFYCKNSNDFLSMSYDEYFKIPSWQIDFSREYSISLPRGLCREIERHYLTYLHQCNPLLFVKCIPSLDSRSYYVNYFAQSTSEKFTNFMKKNNLDFSSSVIDFYAKKLLDATIEHNNKTIESGLYLQDISQDQFDLLKKLLDEYGFDANIYLAHITKNDYVLDYRIYGLLYDTIMNIFNEKSIDIDDTLHAQWLKREGEETYIYYSDDEIITKVAEISLLQNQKNEDFVLCPITAQHNFFVPRLCYKELLQSSLYSKDTLGFDIEINEGKRIIHFMKMPLAQAGEIYLEIIQTNPSRYKKLTEFVHQKLNKNGNW
ncbi:MAG: methyltransferase domain-containing protein [Candidatus Chromulinivorax sp.]